MYIKYLNNIHNIKKYYSLIKSDNSPTSLNLIRETGDSMILKFENENIKKFVISKIWDGLETGKTTLDLDSQIELFKKSKKYNL